MTRRYFGWRLGQACLVVWAAYTLTFIVLYLIPGDPVRVMLGAEGAAQASPQQLADLRHSYGLDRPIIEQYFDHLWHALQGNFGQSYSTKDPVSHILMTALPNTLVITALGLLFAAVLAAALILASEQTRFRWLSDLLSSVPALGVCAPPFWIGLLLLQFFSFRWGIFPATGDGGLSSAVLPSLVLALAAAATLAQLFGRSMRDASTEAYAETAVAKGASRTRVIYHHQVRNSLLTPMASVSAIVGGLFAHSVVSEKIFSRNGLGQVIYQAVTAKDTPLVEGAVVLVAALYAGTALVIDLLIPLVDPRVRLATARTA